MFVLLSDRNSLSMLILTIFTVTFVNILLTREICFPPDGRVSTRVAALLLGHEPVVVAPAACEGELLTFSCLLVVEPSRMISKTRSFRLGFAANRNLWSWPAQ